MEWSIYQLFYTANLVFIVTNLYGWMLKWFYKVGAYSENHDLLFPGQRYVGLLYLMQIFEIPYLLMVGNTDALFYVNTFSVLLFPALMIVMCKAYFFLNVPAMRKMVFYFLPVVIISGYLLAGTLGWIKFPPSVKNIIFWITTIIVIVYLSQIVKEQLRIRRRIRNVNEMSYSSESDFPVRFAETIEWLPVVITMLMYINFVADDVWVKMWRDILFSVVNVWFMFYTLNPHRTLVHKQDREVITCNEKYRLTEARCSELQISIFNTITAERLYLEPHLSVDSLAKKMGTNKNYISEAFVRSEYGSFYNAINQFRTNHAAELLINQPEMTIEAIAKASGFSSASLFSRLFKQYKGISPSQFSIKNR